MRWRRCYSSLSSCSPCFVTGQYALSTALTGRDEQLADLNARLAALADELNMAEAENAELTVRVSTLTAENESLSEQLESTTARIGALGEQLDEAEELSDEAQLTIAMLSEQMDILREELARLNAALEASEAREEELESQIVNLGSRLNAALASEVARLSQYRSDFFGRLVEILGNRSGVRVVGDRFVFETDILFDSASAELFCRRPGGFAPHRCGHHPAHRRNPGRYRMGDPGGWPYRCAPAGADGAVFVQLGAIDRALAFSDQLAGGRGRAAQPSDGSRAGRALPHRTRAHRG